MFRFRLQPTPCTIVTFGMLSGQRSTLGNGLSGELRVCFSLNSSRLFCEIHSHCSFWFRSTWGSRKSGSFEERIGCDEGASMFFFHGVCFFVCNPQISTKKINKEREKKTGGRNPSHSPQKLPWNPTKWTFVSASSHPWLPTGGWVGEFSSQAALQGEDPKCGKGKPQDAVRREEEKMASTTISHTRQRQSP